MEENKNNEPKLDIDTSDLITSSTENENSLVVSSIIEDTEASDTEESVSDLVSKLEQEANKPTESKETNEVNVDLVLDLINKMNNTNTEINADRIVEYIKYLLCGEARPVWAEKLLSDGDMRLKEYEMIIILRSMSSLPKVDASTSILLDSIIKDLPTLKYMTVSEKINILERLSKVKKDVLDASHNYTKLSKEVQSLPLVYRQLLDELFRVPTSKIERLKLLPKLIDTSDEQWSRIVEIANIKN